VIWPLITNKADANKADDDDNDERRRTINSRSRPNIIKYEHGVSLFNSKNKSSNNRIEIEIERGSNTRSGNSPHNLPHPR
jgi:hypothetical protein